MNILVLCTGNSARSILLESLLNHHADTGLTAYSAGSQPAGQVHPHGVAMLRDKGHDVTGLRSKSWDEFATDDAPEIDIVITVCGAAAAETCPMWPGTPLRAHWGIEDPAAATEQDAPAAFSEAYARLLRRTEAFLAAPLATMDRATLQKHLVACGELG
jgi:arsenate reductase (thioredoxin)